MNEKIKVMYIHQRLVRVKENSGKERVYLMEWFLEGKFEKFANLKDLHCTSDRTLAEQTLIEFSHWTHNWTDQALMVANLQGIYNTSENLFRLTDPTIYSVNQVFGHCQTGIDDFLTNHETSCILEKIPELQHSCKFVCFFFCCK